MIKLQVSVLSIMLALSLGLKIHLGAGPIIGRGLRDDEATTILNTALTNLAANDGPSYTIEGINSAMQRIPWSANLYEIDANLVDLKRQSKTCNVTILRNHLESNGEELTNVVLKCADEEEVVKSYSEQQN